MHRLVDRVVEGRGVEAEEGAEPGGDRGRQVRDVVLLVGVEADRPDQARVHLVRDRDGGEEPRAAAALLLRDGDERRDAVGGMRVVGGQEGVVEVQLTDGRAVGPGRPLGMHGGGGREPEERGAGGPRMGEGHRPGDRHRPPVQRGQRHRRVVHDAARDHVGHVRVHAERGGASGEDGEPPGELGLPGQTGGRRVNPGLMDVHAHRDARRAGRSGRCCRRAPRTRGSRSAGTAPGASASGRPSRPGCRSGRAPRRRRAIAPAATRRAETGQITSL